MPEQLNANNISMRGNEEIADAIHFRQLEEPLEPKILVKIKLHDSELQFQEHEEFDENEIVSIDFIKDENIIFNNIVRTMITFSNIHWIAEKTDFEVIHGASRIILLIPDKLFTTMVLTKEGLQGVGRLIDLVTDLLTTYLNLIRPQSKLKNECEGNQKNFKECLENLHFQLNNYKSLLEVGQYAEAEELARETIQLCDDIRVLCHVYLFIAHLAFIKSDRVIQEDLDEFKDNAQKKLDEKGGNHLMNEYLKLKREQHI